MLSFFRTSTKAIATTVSILTLSACSLPSEDAAVSSGSEIYADLGDAGNKEAIRKNNNLTNAFKRNPNFGKKYDGTAGIVYVTGFGGFQGINKEQNVSYKTLQAMNKRSVIGAGAKSERLTSDDYSYDKSIVERDGKRYTLIISTYPVNYGSVLAHATALKQINPDAAVSLGASGGKTRVESGSTGAANTRVAGYDMDGNVSSTMGANQSSVLNEEDITSTKSRHWGRRSRYSDKNTEIKIGDQQSLRDLGSRANLPVSESSDTIGDYLCAGFGGTSTLIMNGEGGEFIKGNKSEGITDPDKPRGAIGFVHINPSDDPNALGSSLLDSAIDTIPVAAPASATEGTDSSIGPPAPAAPEVYDEAPTEIGLH